MRQILGDYCIDTVDKGTSLLATCQDYKRMASIRMNSLDPSQVGELSGRWHVSQKLDGECTMISFENGVATAINPGGTVRTGLPCIQEAAEALAEAGITTATIVGELYIDHPNRRGHVYDLNSIARSPKTVENLNLICFAAFDVIDIDGKAPANYEEAWDALRSIFLGYENAHPVRTEIVDSNEISEIYGQWVDNWGSEGIVVRSSAGTFKVKPTRTIDLVVIGYSEGTGDQSGTLHDLLLAIVRPDGALHTVGRVSSGFDREERINLLRQLRQFHCKQNPSRKIDQRQYIQVRPEMVVEVQVLDLIFQNNADEPIRRTVIEFDRNADQYRHRPSQPICSMISPRFVRVREDKQCHVGDVGRNQLTQHMSIDLADTNKLCDQLPKSEVLQREVYTKSMKDKVMVRKLRVARTHKEDSGAGYYPYVVTYVEFSPNTAKPLKSNCRRAHSIEEAIAFMDAFRADKCNVKGWSRVS